MAKYEVGGGGGAVSSVFGRIGAVIAAVGDYAASFIINDSTVAGANVSDALNTLKTSIAGLVTGVSSAFGRTGAVIAAANDYSAQQIFQLDIGACACATTGNIALTGEQTIDGVLTSGSRVLVWKQTTPQDNGIYVSAAGAWARAADQNAANEFRPAVWFDISGGTTQGGTLGVLLTTGAIVVGTTPLQYGLSFPPPLAGTQDGFVAIAQGGLLTYVSALLSHTLRQTGQTVSLGAQVLLTAPPADMYVVDVYTECTALGTGTLTATVSYTDDVGAATQVTAALVLTATGHQSTRFCFWCASGNISISTTSTAAAGAVYAISARAQRLWSSQ